MEQSCELCTDIRGGDDTVLVLVSFRDYAEYLLVSL